MWFKKKALPWENYRLTPIGCRMAPWFRMEMETQQEFEVQRFAKKFQDDLKFFSENPVYVRDTDYGGWLYIDDVCEFVYIFDHCPSHLWGRIIDEIEPSVREFAESQGFKWEFTDRTSFYKHVKFKF